MRFVTSLTAALVALAACVTAGTAGAAPVVAPKAALTADSQLEKAGFFHRRGAVKMKKVRVVKAKKAKKKMKRYVAGYRHCGTFKYRKAGKCTDKRGPAMVAPVRHKRVSIMHMLSARMARPARVAHMRKGRPAVRAKMVRKAAPARVARKAGKRR